MSEPPARLPILGDLPLQLTFAARTGLSIEPIGKATASEVVVTHHYLHRPPPISYSFGLYQDHELGGVVTFGTPPSRHLQQGVCPEDPSRVIELNRLWVADVLPRNTESWFVSRALHLLPPFLVISYADTSKGHMGYVYRALNFHYAGWTDRERAKPRVDYLSPTGLHSRDAFRKGEGRASVKVPRPPKVKYWTATGDRRERRDLTRACCWPVLDWKVLPPPTEHVQHRLSA
jgi:hypothetical protein